MENKTIKTNVGVMTEEEHQQLEEWAVSELGMELEELPTYEVEEQLNVLRGNL